MTYIDIHGYRSNPKSIWHPQLHRLILDNGGQVRAPFLPGEVYPLLRDWLSLIDHHIQSVSDEVTLIGHSLGTRAVLAYLAQSSVRVDQVVLIGPFSNNPDNASFKNGAYANFFESLLDTQYIRSQVRRIIVIGSQDDSRIPFAQAKEVAQELDALFYSFAHSDHFREEQWAQPLWECIQS